MFNLESAIANWRQQMLAAGVNAPVPLDELETHLRETITQHIHSGLTPQAAFAISTQDIGEPQTLHAEFNKNEKPFMNQIAKIISGFAGLLLGAALMIPGCIQLHDELLIGNGKLALWLLGWFSIVGSTRVFQQMIQRRVAGANLTAVELTPVKQAIKTGAGIAVLLTGLALMLPAAGQAWSDNMVNFAGLGYAVFGLALLMTGTVVTLSPYKKRRA
jgi:hypothetical protein